MVVRNCLLILFTITAYCRAEFPSGKFKDLIEGATVNAEPKDIAGTWITVYEGIYPTKSCPSSYTEFKLENDKTLKATSYCYTKQALKDESKREKVDDIVKKKTDGDPRAIFSADGTESNGGMVDKFTAYFFFVEKDVQAYYTTVPDETKVDIAGGWDINIAIRSDKKDEFLAKTGDNMNAVQMSVAKAVQKFLHIKREHDLLLWENPKQSFGLFGPTYFCDLAILRPE